MTRYGTLKEDTEFRRWSDENEGYECITIPSGTVVKVYTGAQTCIFYCGDFFSASSMAPKVAAERVDFLE